MSDIPKLSASTDRAPDAPLLELKELHTWYPAPSDGMFARPEWIKAVNGITLDVMPGETLGLVGESGCGKSTLGRSIVQLEIPKSGQILFQGENIVEVSRARRLALRREMQMIFQDPMSSLDPRMTIRSIIAEGLVIQGIGRDERDARIETLIAIVGLRREVLERYPHEFSGGQRQRIGIARALALRPKLVVADEPLSALDVSVQSQVLNLLHDLQLEIGLTYLFISHDLSVIEYISDRVGVMYLGRLVELADTDTLFSDPRMPYTQALLSAIPGSGGGSGRKRIRLKGEMPSPRNPPSGCPFRTRCWKTKDICATSVPALREITPRHQVACHFADEPGQR